MTLAPTNAEAYQVGKIISSLASAMPQCLTNMNLYSQRAPFFGVCSARTDLTRAIYTNLLGGSVVGNSRVEALRPLSCDEAFIRSSRDLQGPVRPTLPDLIRLGPCPVDLGPACVLRSAMRTVRNETLKLKEIYHDSLSIWHAYSARRSIGAATSALM